jgi:hypothetical protein
MKRRFFQSALIVFLFVSAGHAENTTSRDALLKGVADSNLFASAGEPALYDETNIEKLDAASAPSLRLYGLRGVTVQEWTASAGRARAALFEMIDAGAAYGFYALQRSASNGTPTPTLIGANSFQRGNQLYFWQSNYAVRIDAPPALQTQLAQLLSRNILGRSQKPPVASYLPVTNMVDGSERYFIDPTGIPAAAAGVDPNQLGFDSSAEAATAEYRINGSRAHLLLLLYPTQHIAKKYTEALPGGPPEFRKRAGPLFAMVYGTNDDASAATILNDVHHEFRVTWDEEKPGLGLGPIIVTVATFVVIVLAFTTIIGLGYGGLRIFVKNRYPSAAFAKGGAAEVIQLKLIQEVTGNRADKEKRIENV